MGLVHHLVENTSNRGITTPELWFWVGVLIVLGLLLVRSLRALFSSDESNPRYNTDVNKNSYLFYMRVLTFSRCPDGLVGYSQGVGG